MRASLRYERYVCLVFHRFSSVCAQVRPPAVPEPSRSYPNPLSRLLQAVNSASVQSAEQNRPSQQQRTDQTQQTQQMQHAAASSESDSSENSAQQTQTQTPAQPTVETAAPTLAAVKGSDQARTVAPEQTQQTLQSLAPAKANGAPAAAAPPAPTPSAAAAVPEKRPASPPTVDITIPPVSTASASPARFAFLLIVTTSLIIVDRRPDVEVSSTLPLRPAQPVRAPVLVCSIQPLCVCADDVSWSEARPAQGSSYHAIATQRGPDGPTVAHKRTDTTTTTTRVATTTTATTTRAASSSAASTRTRTSTQS